jgi:two-component system, sensor histidine kinase and response regulator
MSRLRHPGRGGKHTDPLNTVAEAEKAALAYIDYAITGILQTDRHGRILRANPAAASITGIDIKQLPGSHLHALISETSVSRAKRHMALLDEQGISHTELKAVHSDGRELVIEMASVEVEDGHFVHVFDDVTEQRHMVAEINRARASAESANRAKSAFLTSISHELRTPLNGIIGLGQLTLNGSLDDVQRDYIRKIVSSGQTLLHILNDLLDTAKLESGQMLYEKRPYRIADLFTELSPLAEQATTGKNLDVDFSIDQRVPDTLLGDALRIGQCLRNLLSNAIKFTVQGGIRIEADVLAPDAQNQSMLRIRVIDTGIGMTQTVLDHLCAPFSQAEASTARLYGGTGLGLYITRQIAEGMGGKLLIESTLGVGSRFTLILPLAISSESADQPPATDPAEVPDEFRGSRVLVAEDDAVNRIILGQWLHLAGIETLMVTDGQALLDLLATSSELPDLILMDVQMPAMNGLEATRTLRGRGYQKPIIGLSAGVSQAEQKDCIDAGMNDFIAKPIILDELWGALTRWLPPVQRPSTVRIETAETRFMGNRDALARARAAFIACHADDADLFRRYLAATDHKAIFQLAHSLKGASSILGYEALAELAGTLEKSIEQIIDNTEIERLIDQLDGLLKQAVIDAERSAKDDS